MTNVKQEKNMIKYCVRTNEENPEMWYDSVEDCQADNYNNLEDDQIVELNIVLSYAQK